ncbi:MAG: hypothetical protein IRZ10_02610 [Thermoflavifilum sp.]|nr:hypothetical protein [Thermoflavifilum sp.]MCL6513286.1 hypothetical protein [Alicyclobacillus sp.]
MRRTWLHLMSLALIWIGAIWLVASFIAKFWLQITLSASPYFFAALLAGIVLYIAVRVV